MDKLTDRKVRDDEFEDFNDEIELNSLAITSIFLRMNAMLYYHAFYKIDKILWLRWMYEYKLIDFNDKEYSEIIDWKEAQVISNKEFLWKWVILKHNIEFEVKMTDEKMQLIQSDYLMAQLLSNNFKRLTVQINKIWLSKLLEFYLKTVILPKLKITK